MDLVVERLAGPGADGAGVEIVERKGLGHPDSICDSVAEQLSLSLSRYYLEHYGLILHHNVDKVLLWAGSARPAFGGGEVLEPFELFLAGRATLDVEGTPVPVQELAIEGTRTWLRDHLRNLDVDRHVKVHCLIRPGARELVELYLRQKDTGIWLANDTSCGVGYAPLSPLERVVQGVERRLNAAEVKDAHPEIGEDVKVMGVRHGREIRLTVACAFVGRFVPDLGDYQAKRDNVARVAETAAGESGGRRVRAGVNTADEISRGSVYLTVTGTSAEAGDDGQAGRGNRANGLITPYRPMTLESVAGKNPVTHVGKLYNLAAGLIAASVVDEVPEVGEAECRLVSRIGRPISDPQVADVRVRCPEGVDLAAVSPRVREIVDSQLAALGLLTRDLIQGSLAVDRWPLRA